MDSTTLRDWDGDDLPAGYYLATYDGFIEVVWIDTDWYVRCVGGRNFSCTPDTELYDGAEIVDTFGDMDRANEKICYTSGNVRKALKNDAA